MYAATWDINFFLNQLVSDFIACFYPSEEIDAMVKNAKVLMNPEERYQAAHKILELVHEEAVYLFLYNGMPVYGISKKVKGFVPRSEEFMDLWKVSLSE